MDRIGKPLGLAEIGLARLPPQEVGVGRVREAARNRVFDAEPRPDAKEPFCGAFAALVVVAWFLAPVVASDPSWVAGGVIASIALALLGVILWARSDIVDRGYW